jgi:hypothetical protein
MRHGTARIVSACGVLCSECPAYLAGRRGPAYQKRVAKAWHRIYGLDVPPEKLTCGGCLGTDAELFQTSRGCQARRCCRAKGLRNCAECPQVACEDLERAQRAWDGVPQLVSMITHADFVTYARPYCGHRRRIDALRAVRHAPSRRKRKTRATR